MSTSIAARRAPHHGASIPPNWRHRLPDPATYYAAHVAKLTRANSAGWAQGTCPFHDDHSASLSVQTGDPHGGWRCFAGCGSGDLVGFHMRLRGMDFKTAVRELAADPAERARMREAGLRLAAAHGYSRCAQQTLELLRRVAGNAA